MVRKMAVVALGAFTLAALVGAAHAQNICAGSKIKAAKKKTACLLGLEAKEAAKGVAPDPAKIQSCEDRFSRAFSRVELKGGCLTTGDAGAIEAKVDAFVDDVDDELSPFALVSNCRSAKFKAAKKKTACLLGLEAKEAAKGVVPDPAKIQSCEDRFSRAFSRAELKGGCLTTGDAAAIEAKVDAFVDDLGAELNP